VFTLTNIRGALITMPHKMAAAALVDEASTAVRIAGSCNAVRRLADGRLYGELFDGEGFTRALKRRQCRIEGARALIIGAGGVGSAIAASLAGAGARALSLFDIDAQRARALADRLIAVHPHLQITIDTNDPAGHDIVVNATPLGMRSNDPLPVDVDRLEAGAWVGDVVMSDQMTPLLTAAQVRGCLVQVGVDMLFEQIPAYLEFFGFPSTTPDFLRQLAEH
jgi:shikimate dehydrogenase